eukprot:g15633.t1
MVMTRTPNRWLGLIGAAVIASAVNVSAYHDYYYSSQTSEGCYDPWLTDGYCDNRNNKAECDYDGGE